MVVLSSIYDLNPDQTAQIMVMVTVLVNFGIQIPTEYPDV